LLVYIMTARPKTGRCLVNTIGEAVACVLVVRGPILQHSKTTCYTTVLTLQNLFLVFTLV